MADAARKRMEDQVEFSPQAKRELSEMLDAVVTITTYALDMFSHNNQEHMQEILDLENKVDRMERELQESHIQRLTRNECTAEAGMMSQIFFPDWSVWQTMQPTLLSLLQRKTVQIL